ncbi:hypothetical protein HP550_05160 [Cellulomonas humilata]|uniref:Uncharacterized protein n=1 Tax=Cellulomonas humilata TaxID=144055 RepID=A0A7Y5ZYW1_9CELL|nr:hypothetical protein [Cellulomonas humilata]NUU16636.1 hypothetical protein [Cellulomonas humilata]
MTTTSADLFPPDQHSNPRWVARCIGLLVLWAVWTFAIAAVLLLTGTAGKPSDWVVAVVAMLSALAPTWLVVRAARRRWTLMAGSAVVLLALGLALGTLGGPSLARMTSVGASLPVATGAQLMTTSSVENALCMQECSRVVHLYAVPDPGAAQAEVGVGLVADGWRAENAGGFCRDGFGVAFVDGADSAVVDPPAAPTGLELLSIVITDCGHI